MTINHKGFSPQGGGQLLPNFGHNSLYLPQISGFCPPLLVLRGSCPPTIGMLTNALTIVFLSQLSKLEILLEFLIFFILLPSSRNCLPILGNKKIQWNLDLVTMYLVTNHNLVTLFWMTSFLLGEIDRFRDILIMFRALIQSAGYFQIYL